MRVEQFVMAYQVEQDRLRAMLPEGYISLRPVLRINAEIQGERVYLEYNTPVAAEGKRGWLNIAHWKSPETNISYERDGEMVTFCCSFLKIAYHSVGIEGGCPAERDNDGCFFLGETVVLRPAEQIDSKKIFCDCEFRWSFAEGDAYGKSCGGKTIGVTMTEPKKQYEKQMFSAETAAKIPCEQILGAYVVKFER